MQRFFDKSSVLRMVLATALLAMAGQAWAHHPMGGVVPATFWQGLLSGLGHPMIEFDHLVFLLGAAAAAALTRVSLRRAAAFLAAFALAGAIGTAVRVPGIEIPYAEIAVAISLMAVALWLWFRRLPDVATAGLLAAIGGFIHGYAYGEAVIGAEMTPLAAYLGGLALIQVLLLASTCMAVRWLAEKAPRQIDASSRLLGALMAGVAVGSGLAALA